MHSLGASSRVTLSFACLLTDTSIGWSRSVVLGGSRQTSMLFNSKRSVTELVKLSMMTNAGVSSSKAPRVHSPTFTER